jgi:cytochrome b involved in lipid metabolism
MGRIDACPAGFDFSLGNIESDRTEIFAQFDDKRKTHITKTYYCDSRHNPSFDSILYVYKQTEQNGIRFAAAFQNPLAIK